MANKVEFIKENSIVLTGLKVFGYDVKIISPEDGQLLGIPGDFISATCDDDKSILVAKDIYEYITANYDEYYIMGILAECTVLDKFDCLTSGSLKLSISEFFANRYPSFKNLMDTLKRVTNKRVPGASTHIYNI
jgi:hypothetical protein